MLRRTSLKPFRTVAATSLRNSSSALVGATGIHRMRVVRQYGLLMGCARALHTVAIALIVALAVAAIVGERARIDSCQTGVHQLVLGKGAVRARQRRCRGGGLCATSARLPLLWTAVTIAKEDFASRNVVADLRTAK